VTHLARGHDSCAYGRRIGQDGTPDEASATAKVAEVWAGFGDPRAITAIVEVSAQVSTNRVFKVSLDDGTNVFTKISNYGSYFLFVEDHDRVFRLARLLRTTRWEGFLADTFHRTGHHGEQVWTFYDGEHWAVIYDEVPKRQALPRVLTDGQVETFATEIAEFHRSCHDLAPQIPPTATSIRSDAVHLLDLVSNPTATDRFHLTRDDLAVVRRHTHTLLERLIDLGYDDFPKIPVLVDWNLGNFSVDTVHGIGSADGDVFHLFSRWDYDWFRIETRMVDFYFLSRVSSRTGDRTHFTYSPHTLLEPRFRRFLAAYHAANPLTPDEVTFLAESYRFFILNYVVREGEAFFRSDLAHSLQQQAVHSYLPMLDRFDVRVLHDELWP
jgi:hypothetical protein